MLSIFWEHFDFVLYFCYNKIVIHIKRPNNQSNSMYFNRAKKRIIKEYDIVRTILHSDLNNFYASVEVLKHPEYKDCPLVVCGSVEDRHGIVLAKNQIAKEYGIKTGDVLWEARQKCRNIVAVEADHNSYEVMSKKVRQIYSRFTDHIEAFGIDECWLDITDSVKNFGTGEEIAEQIRQTVKVELGITVSIGVSFNKVFAKLGSDMKKPDAITIINKDNYRQKVWPLPAEELLFVGKSAKKKLNSIGIYTIGDIANTDIKVLDSMLGVWGETFYRYANGLDDSPVIDKPEEVKSISNSLTYYRDLVNFDQVKTLILMLAESVASRLRESGIGKANTVKVTITDNTLQTYAKQVKLLHPTSSAVDIANGAYGLFEGLYRWDKPVRAVGVGVCDFTFNEEQLFFDDTTIKHGKQDKLDKAIDDIRKKYGNSSMKRARILQDKKLSQTEIKGDPFFKNPK